MVNLTDSLAFIVLFIRNSTRLVDVYGVDERNALDKKRIQLQHVSLAFLT